MDYFVTTKHINIIFNNQIQVVNITTFLNIWKKSKSDKHVLVYIYGMQYSLQYMWVIGPDHTMVNHIPITLSLAYLLSSPMVLPTWVSPNYSHLSWTEEYKRVVPVH